MLVEWRDDDIAHQIPDTTATDHPPVPRACADLRCRGRARLRGYKCRRRWHRTRGCMARGPESQVANHDGRRTLTSLPCKARCRRPRQGAPYIVHAPGRAWDGAGGSNDLLPHCTLFRSCQIECCAGGIQRGTVNLHSTRPPSAPTSPSCSSAPTPDSKGCCLPAQNHRV